MDGEEIHHLVEDAFNAGDAEALVALYEDDAAMATSDGTFVRGRAAIPDQWSGFIAFGASRRCSTQVERG